jgi:DNA (cytosine-5)-methyltransferase 1
LDNIPEADIVIGGPPCQSFSLVGKREPDDDRGKLVFTFYDIVKNIKPKAFLLENVPGMRSARINEKRLTNYLAEDFSKLGYSVHQLKLDASNFFVPQKRKRVFLIGVLDHPMRLPINKNRSIYVAENLNGNPLDLPINVKEALDDLPLPVEKGDPPVEYTSEPHSWYSNFMRKEQNSHVELQEMPTMSDKDKMWVEHIPPGGNYTDIPDEISTKRIMKFKKTGGRTTTYGRLHPEEPAYTINTYFNRPNVGANYHYSQERLITVREALRLQSFPDYFTPYFTTQRSLHKQGGNAVPPLLAYELAEAIKRAM